MRKGRKMQHPIGDALAAGVCLAVALVVAAWAQPANAASAQPVQVAVAPQTAGEPAYAVPPTLVVAEIDLSDQTMTVHVGYNVSYTFPVSTGRGRYHTPTGSWQAQWLSPRHRSKKYDDAPMPWSVFFYGGYAVHGTTDVSRLGQPASHGCIRLHPDNAKIFYDLVKENGKANTRITVVD